MGDLSDFQRGQTVGERLAGASVSKTANLLAVSRAAVSRFMMAYTNQGKTSSADSNSGRKPKLSERNRRTLKRIVSQNHRITAAKVTAELVILKTLFPQKQSDESFTNPASTVELQLLTL
jgi:transposase